MQDNSKARTFEGKVVLITGASKGIGGATACAFATEGARLAILGRNKERLEKTATKCREAGAEVLEILCDLAEFENLKSVIYKTVERFNGIDILINNAAILRQSMTEEIEVDWYKRNFQINVDAPVFLSKYALPYIKKSKGCIVNVSSVVSLDPLPGINPYGMAKAALDYFTKVLSSECSIHGVRVNSINPGVVDTDIWNSPNLSMDGDQLKAALLEKQPLGCITTDEVAEGILFLCSAKKVTGATFLMDGGFKFFKVD